MILSFMGGGLCLSSRDQPQPPHLPGSLVCLCLEREGPVRGRGVELGAVGQSENHRPVQQHA